MKENISQGEIYYQNFEIAQTMNDEQNTELQNRWTLWTQKMYFAV